MGTHYRGTAAEEQALNVFIKFTRAYDTVSSHLLRSLKSLGLTMSQLGVLEALLHLGPMCQRQMGDKLLMSRANMTTVVDNLERDGYVQRIRSKEDRRLLLLHLTEKGEELIRSVFPQHLAEITRLMNALTPEEQEQYAKLSKKLGMGNQE